LSETVDKLHATPRRLSAVAWRRWHVPDKLTTTGASVAFDKSQFAVAKLLQSIDRCPRARQHLSRFFVRGLRWIWRERLRHTCRLGRNDGL